MSRILKIRKLVWNGGLGMVAAGEDGLAFDSSSYPLGEYTIKLSRVKGKISAHMADLGPKDVREVTGPRTRGRGEWSDHRRRIRSTEPDAGA